MKTSFLLLALAVSSISAFDHQYTEYGNLLSGYVEPDGVHYDRLSSNPDLIASVRKGFESVDEKSFAGFSTEEQIAYLVNAYNFFTIDLIVRNLPLKIGIRDIDGPWDKKFITLFGKKVSLNHIEHQLLRKKYVEPRIHFALVCASKGCPALPDKPFTALSLDNQLDYAGKRFLKDTTKNRIEGKTLYLSQIFEWYGSDFNATHKGGYREYALKTLGVKADEYKIEFLPYDWGLNSAGNR